MMDMIVHNLKVAVRNMMKYKLQTLISVVSMAVGIVVFSLTLSFLSNIKLPDIYDQPFSDRAYNVTFKSVNTGEWVKINPDMVRALKKDGGPESSEIVTVPTAGRSMAETKFILPDSTIRSGFVVAECMDHDYLNFDEYTSAITGKRISNLKKGEAIIGEELAKKIFKDKSPIGSVQVLTGPVQPIPVKIVDVYKSKSFFDRSSSRDELQFCVSDNVETQDLDLYFLIPWVNVVLKEGRSKEKLLSEINSRVFPLGLEAHLEKTKDEYEIKVYYTYRAIAYPLGIIILLAAVIGFLRTQLQLFQIRKRELTLRIINGAQKRQLFGMLVTEPMLVVGSSIVIAIFLGVFVEDYFREAQVLMSASDIKIENLILYNIEIGVGLLATVSFLAWLTLQRISRGKGGFSEQLRRGRNHLFRNIMLGFQITISILFVCCTLFILRIGQEQKKIYNVPDDDARKREYLSLRTNLMNDRATIDSVLSRIKRLPDLQKIMMYEPTYHEILEISENPEIMDKLNNLDVYRFYFTDEEDTPSVIGMDVKWQSENTDHNECLLIGEDLYKKYEESGLLNNQTLSFRISRAKPSISLPIAGTVKRIPYEKNTECIVAISRTLAESTPMYALIPKTGRRDALRRSVLETLDECDPENINNNNFVTDFRDSISLLPRMVEMFYVGSCVLAGVSLLICGMSIFSAIALDTRRRRKEIAIRKVNGAKSRDIYGLFGRLYLILLVVSMAIAVTMCVPLFSKIVYSVNGDVSPSVSSVCMPIVIGCAVVIFLIALIVGMQIRRVVRVDPSKLIAKE